MEALLLGQEPHRSQSYIDTCHILELRCVRAYFLHTMQDHTANDPE